MFREMTVVDNVKTAMHSRIRQNVFDAILHTPRYRRVERQALEDARGWLDFVGFSHDEDLLAARLPYGEQRRVEIARALASQPRMLLLDEPAAGLNHSEKQDLIALIRRIRDLGIGVVLIEHDMGLVMNISERVVVLNFGKEIAEGTPEEVRRNPDVVEAYLGAEDGGRAVNEGSSSTGSTSSTAGSRPCAASASRSGPARSSLFSATTEPGRPRPCRCSPACTARTAARLPGTARTSRAPVPGTWSRRAWSRCLRAGGSSRR